MSRLAFQFSTGPISTGPTSTEPRSLWKFRHRALLAFAITSLTFMTTGCGNLDPPPVEPEQADILAERDVDEGVESQTDAALVTNDGTSSPLQSKTGSITREQTLIASLTIFALAVFVGFELITKVPPTLHTPLMSGSNAISGIAIVGAALMAGNGLNRWSMFFGFVAVVLASINVVGGFMVTDRMLAMFKKK